MEIQSPKGSKTKLKQNTTTIFGRANLPNKNDTTVSRNHISFKYSPPNNTQTSLTPKAVSFQVLGKNPVWVSSSGSGKVEIFKRFQKGEFSVGDKFCLSGSEPVWFCVVEEREGRREEGSEGSELRESLEEGQSGDFELGDFDASDFDPVKEFGFLVVGHEFDQYPRQRIRAVKDWNWFLEEPRVDSDDDENSDGEGNRKVRKKRKKVGKNDDIDEVWTGESEDEKEVATKTNKVPRLSYHTRSRDHGKSQKKKASIKPSTKISSKKEVDYEDEDENEEDETLGGFIVDEDPAEEEEMDEDEEEEEEFDEDEDELED